VVPQPDIGKEAPPEATTYSVLRETTAQTPSPHQPATPPHDSKPVESPTSRWTAPRSDDREGTIDRPVADASSTSMTPSQAPPPMIAQGTTKQAPERASLGIPARPQPAATGRLSYESASPTPTINLSKHAWWGIAAAVGSIIAAAILINVLSNLTRNSPSAPSAPSASIQISGSKAQTKPFAAKATWRIQIQAPTQQTCTVDVERLRTGQSLGHGEPMGSITGSNGAQVPIGSSGRFSLIASGKGCKISAINNDGKPISLTLR
jgi:hypothetical protein